MTVFSKIIDEETKELDCIECGDNPVVDGYTEIERELGYDGKWYVKGYAPEQPAPTHEEQSEKRAAAYLAEVDPLHARKMRKTILGEWTDDDEEEYLAKVKELSEEIEQRYPYPVGE